MRIYESNDSGDTKVNEGGAPSTRAEISQQPMVKTTVRQAVSLHPMEFKSGANTHLKPRWVLHLVENLMLGQVDVPKECCAKPALEQASGRICEFMEREKPMPSS